VVEAQPDGGAEGEVSPGREDGVGPEPVCQQPSCVVTAAGVDGHHPIRWPGLRFESVKYGGQPVRAVMADQKSSYRHGAPP
jgi:hypothetical protein